MNFRWDAQDPTKGTTPGQSGVSPPSRCFSSTLRCPLIALQMRSSSSKKFIGIPVTNARQIVTPVCLAYRWHRVRTWTPCAIGALPSVHDPNGTSAFPGVLQLGSVALPPSDAHPLSVLAESEAKEGDLLQHLSNAGSEKVVGWMPVSRQQHQNTPEPSLCTEDISLW